MKLRAGKYAVFGALVLAGPMVWAWIAGKCGHRTIVDPNRREISRVDLLHNPAFKFRYGDGGGLGGYNIFTVDAGGHCTYLFQVNGSDRARWKRAAFDSDPQSLLELQQLLIDIKATELPREYDAVGVSDGYQRFVNIGVAGYTKTTYWNNWFPRNIERIKMLVETRFIQPHQSALNTAATTKPSRADFALE